MQKTKEIIEQLIEDEKKRLVDRISELQKEIGETNMKIDELLKENEDRQYEVQALEEILNKL